NRTMFVQARQNTRRQFDYTLASIQNACIVERNVSSCTCAANCGSPWGYNEITASGNNGAHAFQRLVWQCERSIMFVQATSRDDGDYDYTLATLQNACTCY